MELEIERLRYNNKTEQLEQYLKVQSIVDKVTDLLLCEYKEDMQIQLIINGQIHKL